MEKTEIEVKADKMGWMPKEKFKGNPDRWRPAEEFVERGENYVPILKDRVKKLETDLEIALKVQQSQLDKVEKIAYDRATADFEAKKKELDEKEAKAFEEQDQAAFKEVKEEREKLTPPEPAPPPKNPVFEDWNKKNKWYGDDPELTAEADAQFDTLLKIQQQKTPGVTIPPEKLYPEIEKRVRMLYPDKFENPNRENADEVETGGTPPGEKSNKFADLPATAKAAYERQRRYQKENGREFTKEEYLKLYNEE